MEVAGTDTVIFEKFVRPVLDVWYGQGQDSRQRYSALLRQVLNDLGALNRSTERDFLSVGDKLAEFLSFTRQISSDMTALGEILSGEGASHATEVLAHVLEHCQRTEELAQAGDRA